MNKEIYDISQVDYTSRVTITNPLDQEACARIKRATNARVCVGRCGTSLRTETYLRYLSDHAAAMDAVWKHVDEKTIDQLGCIKVQTLAKNKAEYIKRPDLGRRFSEETAAFIKEKCRHDIDVQIIIGDGLSAYAIEHNVPDTYQILEDGLKSAGYIMGTPIFVKYARVATMDKISEYLNAMLSIIFIGERPGLITNESMSIYMAYQASSDKPEAQRNLISNIYKNGIPPIEAGAQAVQLAELIYKNKKSGIDLKMK
ncbi:Ethanolamine ammonia-lyase light chain [Propionispora sp. 2/2-37]|uniref:ethanolamine ammonia-lyase subunit EutC n=1 Tax=Propionispora sp. 2/2-37 TaxID=1677858 RepID=UPI0006C22412|nr:ethanolamine ammonia-lyase subunit EutC [Propionispora sp. 2/2-37]CUH95377.1 Ethanolamine ammonia-lyase light chain [Propionispora sp. 2/2-37]